MPFMGAHTAQNLTAARRRFLKDIVEPYQANMSPAVWGAGQNLRVAIGDTALTFDPAVNGKNWRNPRASSIQVFAPTPTSVRGDGLLHLDVDEALAFTLDQGQQLMAAAGPTLSTMRGHGQVWASSNISRLTDARTWLWSLRDRGREAIESGATSGIAHFEFAYPEDQDPLDESRWADYYPALGDGLVRVEELRSEVVRLGVESFAAEYLGQWPTGRKATRWAAILESDWAQLGTLIDPPGDVVALGVDIDPFGRSASLVTAVADPEHDSVVLELVTHEPGSAWVADAVRRWAPRVQAIGIDDYGPGHDLIYALSDDAETTAKLVTTKTADFTSACYALDSRIREHRALVRQSAFYQAFTNAAAGAERTTGKAWQWERRVFVSQTPVVAATLAAWALGRAPTPEPFFVF
jgi:hypothetical protein